MHLQYFYTIKDLREAVLPMSKLDLKALEEEKLSDEDLKRHRVGGRLVTRREIIRSRKCMRASHLIAGFCLIFFSVINQLAELFFNLEYSENPAVTPTLELAKLALITSRDEEEDEFDKGGTDSSNDTDATLVEDAPRGTQQTSSRSPQSPDRSSSILGKRPRDLDRQRGTMDVDTPLSQSPKEREGFVMVPSQREVGMASSEPSTSKLPDIDEDGDTKMALAPAASKPPPKKRAEVNDSTMMFGEDYEVCSQYDSEGRIIQESSMMSQNAWTIACSK